MVMKRKRGMLVSIKVTPETFYHLQVMAAQSGRRHPGEVVDKLVRTVRCEARMRRREAPEWENQGKNRGHT